MTRLPQPSPDTVRRVQDGLHELHRKAVTTQGLRDELPFDMQALTASLLFAPHDDEILPLYEILRDGRTIGALNPEAQKRYIFAADIEQVLRWTYARVKTLHPEPIDPVYAIGFMRDAYAETLMRAVEAYGAPGETWSSVLRGLTSNLVAWFERAERYDVSAPMELRPPKSRMQG